MKIQVIVDKTMEESEIIIRCHELNDEILQLQKTLVEGTTPKLKLTFYQGEKQFFFPLERILFFETGEDGIHGHTSKDAYLVKYKLYELEDLLPGHFVRVSKSTIVNINWIFSITRNLTASSLVEFRDTYKKVYVSRSYYRLLKSKLDEKRN